MSQELLYSDNPMPPTEVIATTHADSSSPADSLTTAEEQANVIIDASSSFEEGGTATKASAKEDSLMVERFRDLLEYVVEAEETQRLPECFKKDFQEDEDVNWKDWTGNHYFGNDQEKKDKEILLVSYNYENECSKPKVPSIDDAWLKIRRPWNPSQEKPRIGDEDFEVRRYLGKLLRKNPEQFPGCSKSDFDAMVPFLKEEHIPEAADGMEDIQRFMFSAVEHNKGSSPTSEAMGLCYERLYEFGSKDKTQILLGFGHVRTVYKSSKYQTMVNGPLFEVPVVVEFQQGVDGSTELWISPVKRAKICLNVDVMAILNAFGNTTVLNQITNFVETIKVKSLRLDNSDAYKHILKAAVSLSPGGQWFPANSPIVHCEPKKPSHLHVSDAWCLYARERASTVFSKDARQMMDGLENGSMAISNPIRALLSGPNFAFKCDSVKKSDLIYALSASRKQKQVGERLFGEGDPVLTLEGPPGTGKTHSIVNISCTAVSVDRRTLMASSNTGALRAFLEKIPERLQPLVLDMTNSECGRLHQKLKSFCDDVKNLKNQASRQKEKMEKIEKTKEKKHKELQQLIDKANAASRAKRRIFQNNEFVGALEALVKTSLAKQSRGLARAIIEETSDLNFDQILHGLEEDVTMGEGCLKNNAFHDQVELLATSQDFIPLNSLSQREKLEQVRVGGARPTDDDEWGKVLSFLKFRKQWVPKLRAMGFCGEYISDHEKPSLMASLQAGANLESAVRKLDEKSRETLRSLFTDEVSSGRCLQKDYRMLLTDIQNLEAELLYEKIVASLVDKIDNSSLSALTRLCHIVDRMTSLSASTSKRSVRHHQEFKHVFKEVARFMPLVVMTTDQVSEILASDHFFDLAIIDEASQSSCTAVTMARCNQMLAVGDDQQVSPSTVGLSEERIRLLSRKLPVDIPSHKELLPESSFFHAFKTAFPCNYVFLNEHYRCDPRIIAISNEIFYSSRLVPLRLPCQQTVAVEHIKVTPPKEKSKGNQTEAEYIVKRIRSYILGCCENPNEKYETIGVIAMVGSDQTKVITEMIEKEVNGPLMDIFGPKLVDRHRILVGTPQEFQGNERDIVFLSAVSTLTVAKKNEEKKAPMKSEAKKKLPMDNKESTKKAWNVALSRAQNSMILVHSFKPEDLARGDIRNLILRQVMNQSSPHSSRSSLLWDSHPLVDKVENDVTEALELRGYKVEKQGGKVWSTALRVNSNDKSALVLVENGGESEEEWMEYDDQQQSLQRSGRFCLRVDCLLLVLQFEKTLKDVLAFLTECKMPPSAIKRIGEEMIAGSASKKTRAQENL